MYRAFPEARRRRFFFWPKKGPRLLCIEHFLTLEILKSGFRFGTSSIFFFEKISRISKIAASNFLKITIATFSQKNGLETRTATQLDRRTDRRRRISADETLPYRSPFVVSSRIFALLLILDKFCTPTWDRGGVPIRNLVWQRSKRCGTSLITRGKSEVSITGTDRGGDTL